MIPWIVEMTEKDTARLSFREDHSSNPVHKKTFFYFSCTADMIHHYFLSAVWSHYFKNHRNSVTALQQWAEPTGGSGFWTQHTSSFRQAGGCHLRCAQIFPRKMRVASASSSRIHFDYDIHHTHDRFAALSLLCISLNENLLMACNCFSFQEASLRLCRMVFARKNEGVRISAPVEESGTTRRVVQS